MRHDVGVSEGPASDLGEPDPVAAYDLRHFFVVPHTHWDREWYRPLEHFRLELGRVVDGLIETLEQDQSFSSFTLDGQAIVLEDYLDVRPQSEQRLRALLTAGRIEIGPSYVLPDELLVCAESLVRNLLIGRAVCARFGVAPTPVGYLPDSFGHPLQLPQILAGFGIDNFVFSRGLGDELDELGVVFRWRAPDGSEVLAIQQLPQYGNFALLSDVDDAASRVGAIAQWFGSTLAGAGIHDLLLCNGSDHLPVQPELPGWCDELEHRFPGARFTIARYSDYVAALGAPDVGTHQGELLGSRLQNVLRGVNSARLYLKQANERAERRLLASETLSAVRTLLDGRPFPRPEFTFAWRELLRCQPHDSICGCSCDEVHRDMVVRYEQLHRTLDLLESDAVDGLSAPDETERRVGLFNPLPFRRRCVVQLAGAEPAAVELDGFGATTVELSAASATATAALPPAAHDAIESDCLRVQVSADGSLSAFDKRTGCTFDGLHVIEDEPDCGDLYNFCPVQGAQRWRSELARSRILRDGPLVSELELELRAHRPAGLDDSAEVPLMVTTVVRLVHGGRRIEFRTTIDNGSRDHRLRAIFAGAGSDGPARAEGHYTVVHRPLSPLHPASDWAEPPDPTQHTLGAVAVGALTLLTRGLPEYEARSDGALCLTLLRSVGVISQPDGLATRPHSAGPQIKTPEGQCIGRHVLEYALLVDGDTLSDAELIRESQDYRYGFLACPPGLEFAPPLTLEGDVVFSCLKGAEDGDGLILRCFNPSPSPAVVRLAGAVTVSETRLDETGERPAGDGPVRLGPHAIATLRLRPTA